MNRTDTPTALPADTRWPRRTRRELHDELHARPPLAVAAPCVVWSWVHWGMTPACAERALATLDGGAPASPTASGTGHRLLHGDDFDLKHERHGEFVSWQLRRPLDRPLPEQPADPRALADWLGASRVADALPAAFRAVLCEPEAGEMLAATQVLLLRGSDDATLDRWRFALASQARDLGEADEVPVVGARIAAGHAAVLTHLRLHPDGFTRYLVLDFDLAPGQASREVLRLCEIEAYRMLAMLGFPVARREAATLAELERGLQDTVDAMANADEHDDDAAFDALTRLAAEVEHVASRTRFRLSATRAYRQIVDRRLTDLRQSRLEGLQTLTGFLSRRFGPAMALCESTDARLTDIGQRVGRALDLARTRLEVRREDDNQELLKALAHRQHLQLRLQQTVEGLSVVAISYYALGLVGYLAKGAKALPWLEPLHLQPDLVIALAVPPVVLGVAWFVHRLRQHLGGH